MERRKVEECGAWLVLAAIASAGCSGPSAASSESAGGATGGSGGMSTASTDVLLVPSDMGWVEGTDDTIGVQGSWYPYGDQYGAAKCVKVGLHAPSECSVVTSPKPPPETGFPNQDGQMCTTGTTAVILPCVAGLTTSGCPDHDFSNMWGAGIGFDFNAEKGPPDGTGAKHTWNPDAYGIVGVSFEIDGVPKPGLRVEFPMLLTDTEAAAVNLPPGSTTDDHPDGAPYWGATASFGPSPVVASPGVNTIHWSEVRKPGTTPSYVFDRSRMLGIQFHVPAVTAPPAGEYAFCVSKLTFLRE